MEKIEAEPYNGYFIGYMSGVFVVFNGETKLAKVRDRGGDIKTVAFATLEIACRWVDDGCPTLGHPSGIFLFWEIQSGKIDKVH